MKGTLVAWHDTNWPLCPSLEMSKDGGPKRLEKLSCSPDAPAENIKAAKRNAANI